MKKSIFNKNYIWFFGSRGYSRLDLSEILVILRFYCGRLFSEKSKILQPLLLKYFTRFLLGLCKRHSVKMEFKGVGYKLIFFNKKVIKCRLGYSNTKCIRVPRGMRLSLRSKKKFVLKGLCFYKTRSFSHLVKIMRLPDVYKSLGVKVFNERLLFRKQGKKSQR